MVELYGTICLQVPYTSLCTRYYLRTFAQFKYRTHLFRFNFTKSSLVKKNFHYLTDDVIVHPLSPTYLNHGEKHDPLFAMGRAAKRKREKYQPHIDMLRSAQAVVAGLRKIVFRPCAFTSLGGLSADSVKFINAAAGLLKHKATAALRLRPRDDGLLPQQLAKRLRFRARAMIQAAIMRGNSLLASAVGL